MKATGTPGSAYACSSSAKAGMAWAAVDQQIVDQAPAIGLLVPQGVELVSKRVGNYQHNPVWGVALSQLWVV
jgi:ABC-type transport system substrate-binding protein